MVFSEPWKKVSTDSLCKAGEQWLPDSGIPETSVEGTPDDQNDEEFNDMVENKCPLKVIVKMLLQSGQIMKTTSLCQMLAHDKSDDDKSDDDKSDDDKSEEEDTQSVLIKCGHLGTSSFILLV